MTVPLFSRDHLPDEDFRTYAKRSPTRAVRIDGPFSVVTVGGFVARCDDGWLAIDDMGHPYPIHASVFHKTYTEVSGDTA